MAYVSVPNDLSKIKTKVAFNLTKRQLLCFGAAAVVGIPTYLFTRTAIGNTGAMLLMIALCSLAFSLPCMSVTDSRLKKWCEILSAPNSYGPAHAPIRHRISMRI